VGKTYGTKARCYWEHPWGTHWELEGNKGKMKKKKSSPCPTPKTFKNKTKSRYFECMLSLPIGCMKFLFPKLLVTIFGLGPGLGFRP
jgi:hypothetical protein